GRHLRVHPSGDRGLRPADHLAVIDVSGNDVIRTPVATINEQGGPLIGSTALSDQKIGWVQDLRSLGLFGRAWAVGVVLFSVARALLTWPTLSTYGVDPWVFLAI